MKETPDKKLSIIDVAKLAGVSTATVSRVLNGNGGYSKKTEEKAEKPAKKEEKKAEEKTVKGD